MSPPFPNHFLSTPTSLEASLLSSNTTANTTNFFISPGGTQILSNLVVDEKKKK
jgi:hypothetical protein